MRIILNIFFTLFVSSFLIACGSEPIKPDPGRCFINEDCQPGLECIKTRCQDLYYPDGKIRQK